MSKLNILALVQARGGSKGLPNKNILPMAGHPLIAYSIKAALDAPSITRTIVSTDSEHIAQIAKQYGAEVPFIRPTEFAQDLSTDLEVFDHALQWLAKNENYTPDLVVQLRPTTPVRKVEHLEEGIQRLLANPAFDSIRTIVPTPITPYKMWIYDAENIRMKPLLEHPTLKEPFNEPRQKLPPVYWHSGTFDIMRPYVILEKKSMSGYPILPYLIPEKYAIDIDDIYAFKLAEQVILDIDCVKFT